MKLQYALIFMDINLPDMSGLEVVKRINNINKSNTKDKIEPVIIGLTGYLNRELHEKCKSIGMSEVIVKPCTKLKIIQSLKQYKLNSE